MENVAQENEKSIAGVIKINEKGVLDHIDGLVRKSVEDTLNTLLNAKADATCNATRSPTAPALIEVFAHRVIHFISG